MTTRVICASLAHPDLVRRADGTVRSRSAPGMDGTLPDLGGALDACAQCGRQLGASPSADFCTEACQGRWHRGLIHPAEADRAAQERITRAVRRVHAVSVTADTRVAVRALVEALRQVRT